MKKKIKFNVTVALSEFAINMPITSEVMYQFSFTSISCWTKLKVNKIQEIVVKMKAFLIATFLLVVLAQVSSNFGPIILDEHSNRPNSHIAGVTGD